MSPAGQLPFSNPRRRTSEEYTLLDSTDSTDSQHPYHVPPTHTRKVRSRRSLFGTLISQPRLCAYAGVLLIIIASTLIVYTALAVLTNGLPPKYSEIRQFENEVSKRNTPVGSTQKFLRFPGHNTGKGMNNYLQEIYFMGHLAYLSNRTFVYDDYVWSHNPTPYTFSGFSIIPSRLPLHAVVRGSESGDIPRSNSTTSAVGVPRAVSAQWYETICPPSQRVTINPPGAPESAQGDALLEFWTDLLRKMSEPCVEVDERRQPIFHQDLFASSRLLSAWDSLRDSPVLKGRSWSPLVQSALSRNLPLVVAPSSTSPNASIAHVLAMHIRRGDFKGHCRYLAKMEKEYCWINQDPQIPDRFTPENVPESERVKYYIEHCWVEIEDIVRKAHELRALSTSTSSEPLRTVYIMTNGDAVWIQSVTEALLSDGWEDVKTTKDLLLDRWERYIDETVDMAIAERAGMFVGNGFSSLTSNVVMFRALAGKPMDSNRFW